jgi:hypothetical protein
MRYLPLAFLLLAGCAHQPLMTSCITKDQLAELERQEPPKVKDKLTGHADEDIRPIAGSNLRLRAWGHNLLDTLRVCAS